MYISTALSSWCIHISSCQTRSRIHSRIVRAECPTLMRAKFEQESIGMLENWGLYKANGGTKVELWLQSEGWALRGHHWKPYCSPNGHHLREGTRESGPARKRTSASRSYTPQSSQIRAPSPPFPCPLSTEYAADPLCSACPAHKCYTFTDR